MCRAVCVASFMLLLVASASAATTPLDTKLADDSTTTIECELKSDKEFAGFPAGGRPKPGVYHYKLYIPNGYNENEDLKYPLLSIASPGGNANMSNVSEYVKKYKWVVIMLAESSNKTGWNVMAGNAVAAHDDVMKRVRIQEGVKFATGFSGGARGSNQLLSLRDDYGGMVYQGAGFWWIEGKGSQYQWRQLNPKAFHYAIFGHKDGNCSEIRKLKKDTPAGYLKLDLFDGAHTWAPSEHMSRGLDWLIEQTVVEGKTRKKEKGIYFWHLSNQIALLEASQSNFEKYELMSGMLSFTKKHRLKLDDKLKEKLSEWQGELKELKRDSVIKKELSAKKAYLKVVKAELKPGKISKKKKSKGPLNDLADSYEKIVKKYEGTSFAEEASARAKSLRLQATLK